MTVLTHAALAEMVHATEPRLGRTRLVAVDGPAGSGKTTLVSALLRHLPDAAVVHMDDVYRGWDTDFDEVHERLREQVVVPLSHQRPGRYQRYDWYADELRDWVDLPVPGTLLLEGVGSGSTGLDDVRSLLVWIEVPEPERLRRGLERDGEAVLPLWQAWMRHEAAEHSRQDTRARADLRLLGDGPSGEPTILPGPPRP